MAEPCLDLGPCCACGRTNAEIGGAGVRTIVNLPKKCPIPGRGWGCLVCGLPLDGASIVLCDECCEAGLQARWACRGYFATDGRVPINELTGTHECDLRVHRLRTQVVVAEMN